MLYRRFGKTELRMPVLSCGGMRFQHGAKDLPMTEVPTENQRNLESIVHRALELGICHFETARGYGSSERQLGRVLPELPREEIIVQTKVPPRASAGEFVRDFRDSLDRLRLDHVDLLGIHGVNDEETLRWTVGRRGCLRAARKLQDDGLVRHVGFSTHGPLDVILRAIRHVEHGGFDYVNLHWYYIFQRNWPAIEEAHARDLGVFIISPSDKGGMLYRPSTKLVELCAPLHPMTFNDLFCLRHPEVHTISVGAARPTDLDLHVEAVGRLGDADTLVPPIAERLDRAMVDAVGEEYLRRFEEGLPHWSDTPGEINIPVILWLRTLIDAYDLVDYGTMRYEWIGKGGHWFPGQNAARVGELDLTAALERSPYRDRIPRLLCETHEILKGTAGS